MRNYTILFIILNILISCSGDKKINKDVDCPKSFISMEHRNYYSMNKDSSDTLNYRASINNIKAKCSLINEQSISTILEILFVIKPDNLENNTYDFSYFVSILNNEEIVDYQLFQTKGEFKLDDNGFPKETNVIESLDQFFPSQTESYEILLGFVLTKEKYDLIQD